MGRALRWAGFSFCDCGRSIREWQRSTATPRTFITNPTDMKSHQNHRAQSRCLFFVLAMLMCFAADVSAQAVSTPRTSTDSIEVARVVRAYQQALTAGDSATALRLLTSDAVILESGGMESREEYRSHHLPSDIEYARAVKSTDGPLSVKVRGDVAWVASTSTAEGQFRGRPVNSLGAELMVLTRTGDGWRIAAIHWSSRSRRP